MTSPFPARGGAPEVPAPLTRRQLAWGAARAALTAYLALGVALWAGQEHLLFPGTWVFETGAHKDEERHRYAEAAGIDEVLLPRGDGSRLLVWHRRSHGDRAVLYLHGNGETVLTTIPLGRLLAADGWDLVAMEFAGFPGCDGQPSERLLHDDLRRTWDWLVQEQGYDPSDLVLHGRSMGGGVIGTVIGEVEPAGWVFESTFDSVSEMAFARYPIYPVRWMLRSPFETASRAPEITAPVLQLHSHDDEVVPWSRGELLAAAMPAGATLVPLRGRRHNEPILMMDPVAQDAYRRFLTSLAR